MAIPIDPPAADEDKVASGKPSSTPPKNRAQLNKAVKSAYKRGVTLTAKQDRFCHEYMVDMNATAAAIRSGYSEKTAGFTGPENLLKPIIQARIEAIKREKLDAAVASAQETLAELTLIARTDMAHYMKVDDDGVVTVLNFKTLPPGATRAIKKIKQRRVTKKDPDDPDGGKLIEVTTELELWDKPKALDLIGQYHNLFEGKESDKNPEAVEKELGRIADALQERDGTT